MNKETFYIATVALPDEDWIEDGNFKIIGGKSPIEAGYHETYATLNDAIKALKKNSFGRVLEFSMTAPYKFIGFAYFVGSGE